jgi:hypothetical protein
MTDPQPLTGDELAGIKARAEAAAERNGEHWWTVRLGNADESDDLFGTVVEGSATPGNPRGYGDSPELWDHESALGMFSETALHVATMNPRMTLRLVAEVERLRAQVDVLRHGLTEQEDDTDFQLRERLQAEAGREATKDALGHALLASAGAESTLRRVRALHLPIPVPAITGDTGDPRPGLDEFVRCSCTPGLLYDDCPTVKVLAGVSR